MTTATGKQTVTISKRVVIAGAFGAFLVAIAVAMLIGFTMGQNQPSEADLVVRAMAGDSEAAEILEARYAPEPISPKEANFTPGRYKKANINATDGAEVVASYLLFSLQGEIEKAMSFVEDPNDSNLLHIARGLYEDNDSYPGGFKDEISRLNGIWVTLTEPGGAPVMGTIEAGRAYYARIDVLKDLGLNFIIRRGADGKWKISERG